MVSYRPSNMLVYLIYGSDQTIMRDDTLRQKLQIKLSISPTRSMLTPGQPVLALEGHQAIGEARSDPRVSSSQGGGLTTKPPKQPTTIEQ